MSISRIETPHINKNDCWNITLAKATGKSYEEIRELFKSKLTENGGLTQNNIEGYLKEEGYYLIRFDAPKVEGDKPVLIKTILESLKELRIIVASFERRKESMHLSYYEDGKHYTTSDTDESFEDPVMLVWVKSKQYN